MARRQVGPGRSARGEVSSSYGRHGAASLSTRARSRTGECGGSRPVEFCTACQAKPAKDALAERARETIAVALRAQKCSRRAAGRERQRACAPPQFCSHDLCTFRKLTPCSPPVIAPETNVGNRLTWPSSSTSTRASWLRTILDHPPLTNPFTINKALAHALSSLMPRTARRTSQLLTSTCPKRRLRTAVATSTLSALRRVRDDMKRAGFERRYLFHGNDSPTPPSPDRPFPPLAAAAPIDHAEKRSAFGTPSMTAALLGLHQSHLAHHPTQFEKVARRARRRRRVGQMHHRAVQTASDSKLLGDQTAPTSRTCPSRAHPSWRSPAGRVHGRRK